MGKKTNTNKVIQTLLGCTYQEKRMKKQVWIAKRSKNRRIQNKAFTQLFYAFMKENPVKAVAKVEVKNGKTIAVLDRFEKDLSRLIQQAG